MPKFINPRKYIFPLEKFRLYGIIICDYYIRVQTCMGQYRIFELDPAMQMTLKKVTHLMPDVRIDLTRFQP